MGLIAPASSVWYWGAVFAFTCLIATAVLRRWVMGRGGVRRGVGLVLGFVVAAGVAGLLPTVLAYLASGAGVIGVLRGTVKGMDAATWLWWSAAVVLGVAGLAVFARTVVGDPSRGRRRCGKCWYDMSGVPGLRCPECGKEARSERGLLRTRRRKRWFVVAGVLMVGAMGTGATLRIGKGEWQRQVPDAVLISMFPYLPDGHSLLGEVRWRWGGFERQEELPPGRWRRFVAGRCLAAMRDSSRFGRLGTALSLLDTLGDDRRIVRSRLLELMADSDPDIRQYVVVATGWFASEDDVIGVIEAALSDPAPEVRQNAARTLGYAMHHGDLPKAPPSDALLAMAEQDSDARARSAAIQMFRVHERSDAAIDVLLAAVNDTAPQVRESALLALGSMDPYSEETIAARRRALTDSHRTVVRVACLEIGRHGPHDPATLAVVYRLATDENEDRHAAEEWLDGLVERHDDTDAALIEWALTVPNLLFRQRLLRTLLMMEFPPPSLLPRLLELSEDARQDREGSADLIDDLEALIAHLHPSRAGDADSPP